jgi:hypothetical protein
MKRTTLLTLITLLAALHASRTLPKISIFGKLRAGSFQALETCRAMAFNDWN